jgi:N6-adenosine-specific RNA methylase IME4
VTPYYQDDAVTILNADCRSLAGLSGFRCIVADPPWDHSDHAAISFGFNDPNGRQGKHPPCRRTHLPYSVMPLAEIEALPVAGCADKDAVLYLWTTSRFLEAAHGVARKWGFKPGPVLVWCKPQNQGLLGGTFLSNVEFVLTAKRGNPKATGKAGSRWFTGPRRKHSEKPHEFQTMVEAVSPGPRLELFARRARLGWTVWGNEVDTEPPAAPPPPTKAGSIARCESGLPVRSLSYQPSDLALSDET